MAQGGLSLFTDAYARLAGPQGCGDSLVSASHLVTGRWVLQMGIADGPDNEQLCVYPKELS